MMRPTFPCGHPRTDENTATAGPGNFRCAECNRTAAREGMRKLRAKRADALPQHWSAS